MTWDSLIHWAAIAGSVFALVMAAITIVCVAFAERNAKPVEDDQFTPEEPWLEPIIEYGSLSDRLAAREERKAWAYEQDIEAEIHDMIGDVRESDHG